MGGVCVAQPQWYRRLRAGTRAPPQPLLGSHAASTLLYTVAQRARGQEGSPTPTQPYLSGQVDGPLERWVAALAAASTGAVIPGTASTGCLDDAAPPSALKSTTLPTLIAPVGLGVGLGLGLGLGSGLGPGLANPDPEPNPIPSSDPNPHPRPHSKPHPHPHPKPHPKPHSARRCS